MVSLPLQPPVGTAVAEPQVVVDPQAGGHDKFTHIVLEAITPTAGEKAGEMIPLGNSVVEGMVNGVPVRALCGKVWVPNDNPARYPVCPTCIEVAEARGWKVPAR